MVAVCLQKLPSSDNESSIESVKEGSSCPYVKGIVGDKCWKSLRTVQLSRTEGRHTVQLPRAAWWLTQGGSNYWPTMRAIRIRIIAGIQEALNIWYRHQPVVLHILIVQASAPRSLRKTFPDPLQPLRPLVPLPSHSLPAQSEIGLLHIQPEAKSSHQDVSRGNPESSEQLSRFWRVV